jgi:hypothetical protein
MSSDGDIHLLLNLRGGAMVNLWELREIALTTGFGNNNDVSCDV